MINVLITGENSYIGTSYIQYVDKNYSSQFNIFTIDMKDSDWRKKNFGGYDIVFHVAGIAHVDIGKAKKEDIENYYLVNTDLAIQTAEKAKEEGVKQFVFMSSAIIYGESTKYGNSVRITKDTEPDPSNFYGDSKWKADKGIRELEDEGFVVTVVRPPMIYGKGSKGNYRTLSKMAKILPIFPEINNKRSMLYIDNLCEFLCQIMIKGRGGIFWPQNKEFVTTSNMVKMIAKSNNHRINVSKKWNWIVWLASVIPGKPQKMAHKAFGSIYYDQDMSKYDFDYQLIDLEVSIQQTEL